MQKLLNLLLVALVAANCTGCAVWTELSRDPRDAPWDPKNGSALFEQIPNWDGAAGKICCSGLSLSEYSKARCDTDQPVAPRSNRC